MNGPSGSRACFPRRSPNWSIYENSRARCARRTLDEPTRTCCPRHHLHREVQQHWWYRQHRRSQARGRLPGAHRATARTDAARERVTASGSCTDAAACKHCSAVTPRRYRPQVTTSFQCERCLREDRYSTWVTDRWHQQPVVNRCNYCGTAHSCTPSGTSAITPPLLGIADPRGVVGAWVDAKYRPYKPGVYDCEFRDGTRLRLVWRGDAWCWTGLVVDTRELLKWRGKWLTE